MKKIEIIPFHSAGEFKLNEKRNTLLSQIDFNLRNTREETDEDKKYIIKKLKELVKSRPDFKEFVKEEI